MTNEERFYALASMSLAVGGLFFALTGPHRGVWPGQHTSGGSEHHDLAAWWRATTRGQRTGIMAALLAVFLVVAGLSSRSEQSAPTGIEAAGSAELKQPSNEAAAILPRQDAPVSTPAQKVQPSAANPVEQPAEGPVDAAPRKDAPVTSEPEVTSDVVPPPRSWAMASTSPLAVAINVKSGRPNDAEFKGRRGFKVVISIEPSSSTYPLFAFPMKGGRLGDYYHFISGSGQTSQGYSCEAWLNSNGVYGTWAMEDRAIPGKAEWTELRDTVRLPISYWCDRAIAAGDSVSFSFGLYILDEADRYKMVSWSASDIPTGSQTVRQAPSR